MVGNKVYWRTRCPKRHEEPKSTILMAERFGFTSSMFSGFRSQWITVMFSCDRKLSAAHSCWANLRVRFSETPRKFVFRNSSYRLYESSSNTRHRWFRNMKWRFSFTVIAVIISWGLLHHYSGKLNSIQNTRDTTLLKSIIKLHKWQI